MAFARGAKPTPRHKLLAIPPHRVTSAPPDQFAVVPKQLSYWGNQNYGDCVTAEEAYAKAVWSIMCGLPETFISEQEVINWANRYGFLNGAYLTEVMDKMAVDGLNVGTVDYKDGPYRGVDYSNEFVLQSAISTGPVKIGIDADALPGGAGNSNGWWSTSTGNFPNEDHCVGLSGYGTAAFLFGELGLPVPSGLNPSTFGYLLFTWSTIGFVTHDWLMSTCQEAFVRYPTTPGQSPSPTPDPGPGPTPTPVATATITIPDKKLPDQRFTIRVGFGTQTITLPGQTVPGGTYTGPVTLPTPPPSDLTASDVDAFLRAAGHTPESLGLTPEQWQQIIALILQLLPIFFPPTPTQSTKLRAGKLTPAQWAAIIQLVLTLLPIFMG